MARSAKVEIVATYLEIYKEKFSRTSSADDNDEVKAEYLIGLIDKINAERTRKIRLRTGNELNLYINAVFNVFDSAYFESKLNPWLAPEDCFFNAESTHLPNALDDSWRLQEVKALAFQLYKRRKEIGVPGDKEGDWLEATTLYPFREIRKKIAQACFNIEENTRGESSIYYWNQACKVIRALEERNIDYLAHDFDLYDSQIFPIVLDSINTQGGIK